MINLLLLNEKSFRLKISGMIWILSEIGDIEFLGPDSLEARARNKGNWAKVGEVFTKRSYPLPVRFLGPMPIEGVGYSDGKASGRVSFVLPHPTDTGVAYISSAGGGVWRTTDGGNTWEPLTDNLPVLTGGALAFNPLNTNVIWYGTGELHYCSVCFPGDGLFKSTDGGNTWVKVASPDVVGYYISRIIVLPTDTNIILVAGSKGVVKSTDGGATWTNVLSGDNVNDLVYREDNPNVLFAATLYSGIYKSTDGGNTWSVITSLPRTGYFRAQIGISRSNPDVMYVGFGDSDYSLKYFYKTTDGGNTWTLLSNTPNYLGFQGFYNHTIVVHPDDPNIVLAGGQYPYNSSVYGIVRSLDGGITWEDITDRDPYGHVHPDIHHMAYGAGNVLWVACDGGVWKSYDNGNSWVNLNQTLGITQFYTLDAHPTDTLLVVGGTQDNGTPFYSGSLIWDEVSGGDGGPVLWRLDNPSYFYTSYIYTNPLYRFRWDGSSVVFDRYISAPWRYDRVSWANGPLESSYDGTPTIFVGSHRLWKSTDGGNTWTSISGDLTGGSGYLLSAAVSHTNPDTIYTGSSDGRFYMTPDGGSTWVMKFLPSSGAITEIWVNPNNSADIYILLRKSSGQRILHSTDAGDSWMDITGDLPTGKNTRTLAVDFRSDPPVIFVGMDDGVYYTTDHSNYIKIAGLPNVIVYNLDLNLPYRKLYVATHGRGIWVVNVSSIVGVYESVAKSGNIDVLSGGVYVNDESSVFTVDGRKITEGKGYIPLSRGLYIVKTKNSLHKVIIR